jgi:hypothetical protein
MKHQSNKTKKNRDGPAIDQEGNVFGTAVLAHKPYETPLLTAFGDVRDITLGGTIGFGESGAGATFFEPD